jgi:ribosomal protein L29
MNRLETARRSIARDRTVHHAKALRIGNIAFGHFLLE